MAIPTLDLQQFDFAKMLGSLASSLPTSPQQQSTSNRDSLDLSSSAPRKSSSETVLGRSFAEDTPQGSFNMSGGLPVYTSSTGERTVTSGPYVDPSIQAGIGVFRTRPGWLDSLLLNTY